MNLGMITWNQNMEKKQNYTSIYMDIHGHDTSDFIVNIKTKDINVDITKYVKTRLDILVYELGRILTRGKYEKNIYN